jgi:septum site-determining protein MinC
MEEAVAFKGTRSGLQLTFNHTVDFEIIIAQLRTKLEKAAQFFNTGTTVTVPTDALTPEQQRQLTVLLADYGLAWEADNPILPTTAKSSEQLPAVSTVCNEANGLETQALIVERTLRGGQKIEYHGSVVILGDLNPAAEVIAGGDIIVLGACRGIAHAGAYGNAAARITANRLLASQLRIAGIIARSPDNLDKPGSMETARIQDGTVVIEPVGKQREE